MTGAVEGPEREGNRGLLLFFILFLLFIFLYHIFVVKVQEIAWSATYGQNKTQNPKQTNNGSFHRQSSS